MVGDDEIKNHPSISLSIIFCGFELSEQLLRFLFA